MKQLKTQTEKMVKVDFLLTQFFKYRITPSSCMALSITLLEGSEAVRNYFLSLMYSEYIAEFAEHLIS